MKTFRNLSIILGTAHAADVQNICGTSVQVLFQSNAYARTLVPSGSSYPYQGGSVITTQGDWDIFLDYFEPNIEGQDLARRTVDFSSEKVAIGTYYASSTCNVVLDKALVECSTREDATYGTFAMDVTDGSRGCDISCMAVGQVVFAVAVPTAWEVDVQDGFEIDVSGGCISEDVSSGCPDGQPEVNCLVDPCEVNTCADGTVCRANYCGGCNFDCIIGTGSSPMHEITTEANLMTETTPPGVSKSSLCGENECLDSDGNCAGIVSCGVSPCLFDPCDEGEICKENYCGGCGFECVPSIPMDTTSTIFPTSSTIRMATPGSNQNGSGGLCGQHRTAFGGPAKAPYLVPNGQKGFHTTIMTSQYELNTLLSSFVISNPEEDDLSGFGGIDFNKQQIIFVTYYTSASCGVQFNGDYDYDCSTSSSNGDEYSLKIGVDVLDESIGCEEACNSARQLVFAVVTPLGAEASFSNAVTGPCLKGIVTDNEELPDIFPEVPAAQETTTTEATIATSTSLLDVTTAPGFIVGGNGSGGLCGQHRTAFGGPAKATYLVPNGQEGFHTAIMTSQYELNTLLSSFVISNPEEDDLSGFGGIDFNKQQIIFVTYYTSASCGVQFNGDYDYDCSTSSSNGDEYSLKIGVDVLDESIGCEEACNSARQLVFAVVTPLGAEASFSNAVTGPCLKGIVTDNEELPDIFPEVPAAQETTTTEATIATSTSLLDVTTAPGFIVGGNGSGGLCGQHRTAFGGPAKATYLVPNGQEGFHTAIMTSQYELNTLLSSFVISNPDEDNLSGFDGIDFNKQQIIFVTYYTSASCGVQFNGDYDYDCSTSSSNGDEYSLEIGVDVLDESIGCEEACNSARQLVFAVVTPLGAEASFSNSATGPCLKGIVTDEEELPDIFPEVPAVEETTTTAATITTSTSLLDVTNAPEFIFNGNGSGGLCGEHRTAFGGPAFSPYLVPNGQEGIHTTIITSQYDLNTLLASLTIVKPNEDNLSGFDGIDFETQQVIFVTYYTSSSCHAEFEGDLDYDCSKSSSTGNQYSLKIAVDVFDESIGCQEACDSEIQLVFAAVTPLGADPSFINSVTGPCLEGNQSATKATTAGAETESTEAPSTKTQFPMSTTAAGSDTTVGPSTTTSTPDLLTTEVASTQSATASATEVNGDDEIVTSSTTAANTDFTTSSTSVSTPTSQTTAFATTTERSSSTTAATTKFTTNTTSNFPTTASSEITSTKTPDAFVSTTSTSLSTPSFRGATTTTFPTEYNITMNATLIPENPLSNVVGANDRGGFEFENSAIVEDTQSSSSMLSITAHFLLLSTVAMIFLM
eukprot:CAMPEP_0171355872 /NCGR_PEP_ID=MMETSP0878-20121228/45437_1 /TAXON_ID=67004 /ORGANISM="Thalassiosira weissflogii, Strain CCMP1336" /LENGTH=1315 /DNA_ID=CAMNT_0011861879 /DNA_START=77 /DNA_END=4024 /DNA_ORIENTATION=-